MWLRIKTRNCRVLSENFIFLVLKEVHRSSQFYYLQIILKKKTHITSVPYCKHRRKFETRHLLVDLGICQQKSYFYDDKQTVNDCTDITCDEIRCISPQNRILSNYGSMYPDIYEYVS